MIRWVINNRNDIGLALSVIGISGAGILSYFNRKFRVWIYLNIWPFGAHKRVTQSNESMRSLAKEVAILRSQLESQINLRKKTQDVENKIPENRIKRAFGVLFFMWPEVDIGPYCQKCYYEKPGHQLHPVKATNHDSKVYFYCPSCSGTTIDIPEQAYLNTYEKFESEWKNQTKSIDKQV